MVISYTLRLFTAALEYFRSVHADSPPPTVREESRRSKKISPPQISTVTGSKCDTVTSSDLPVWVLIVKNVDRKHEVGTLTFSCFFCFVFFFTKWMSCQKQQQRKFPIRGLGTAARRPRSLRINIFCPCGTMMGRGRIRNIPTRPLTSSAVAMVTPMQLFPVVSRSPISSGRRRSVFVSVCWCLLLCPSARSDVIPYRVFIDFRVCSGLWFHRRPLR